MPALPHNYRGVRSSFATLGDGQREPGSEHRSVGAVCVALRCEASHEVNGAAGSHLFTQGTKG